MNNALGYLSREGSDFTAERMDGEWILRMGVDRGVTLVAAGSSLIAAMTRLASALNAVQKTVAAAGDLGFNLDAAKIKIVSSHGGSGDDETRISKVVEGGDLS